MKLPARSQPVAGAWELMPEHGAKPVAILVAERMEYKIEEAERLLCEMKKEFSKLADVACCRLYDIFGLDAMKALHSNGAHWWMVERMLDQAKTEGLLRERSKPAKQSELEQPRL